MSKQKYDLYSQEFKNNAHAVYAQMRGNDPAILQPGFFGEESGHICFLTKFEDIQSVLRDHKTFTRDFRNVFSAEQVAESAQGDPTFDLFNSHLLAFDPPDHTRLRRLINKVFTTKMVEKLRPRIEEIADSLIDNMLTQSECDLLTEFAFPLPITVIAEMLGVPVEDQAQIRDWSNLLVTISENQEEDMVEMLKFGRYLFQLIEARRQQPQDDLISALVAVEEEGEKLNQSELMGMMMILIVAGHETTTNLIATGSSILLQKPDVMADVSADLSKIPDLVEELIRLASPADRALTRWAMKDTTVGGTPVAKGQAIICILGSANRDEDKFEQSNTIAGCPHSQKHIGFGTGIHFCVGAPLARLEGQIAFAKLLTRLPNLRLAVDPSELQWRTSPIIRGLTALPVQWDSA